MHCHPMLVWPLIERREKGRQHRVAPALLTMSGGNQGESGSSQFSNVQSHQSRLYNLNRKRPIAAVGGDIAPHDSTSNVGSATMESVVSNSVTHERQTGQGGGRAYHLHGRSVPTAQEIDDFLKSSSHGVFMVRAAAQSSTAQAQPGDCVHCMAFIDSQASYFAVPDASYLSKVTEWSPRIPVETANGVINPEAVGELILSLMDDNKQWHTFVISEAWVLQSCKKLLYSQTTMHKLGVTHRLDDGYIILPNGARKTISKELYSIDLTLGHPSSGSSIVYGHIASVCEESPRVQVAQSSIPQKLLWQRLGCPSQHAWSRVGDVLSDHGLPPNPHLKYDFDTTEAVACARSRLLPFHRIRDPDTVHAPASTVYMDFAGPMVASFPHQFIYYCGAIDAGSGYARLLPCHAATKEVAKQCLELLVADIRVHMGLTHRFTPQVVVSDQGTQFMLTYFRDFLSDEQIVHRPAVAYTPQQNSFVERMWGTRFGTARTLLKAANLGPAFHPFAVQTSNWICNRLPQQWRGNHSPYYILSRRPASVAYLKVFGSLTRMTIPWAQRDGDKHFADRGVLGIYLGPSESSPGSVVYVPATRRFYTSRNVICYEDTQPGVKGIDSKWKADEPIQTIAAQGEDSAATDILSPPQTVTVSSHDNDVTESPICDPPPNDQVVDEKLDDFETLDQPADCHTDSPRDASPPQVDGNDRYSQECTTAHPERGLRRSQ